MAIVVLTYCNETEAADCIASLQVQTYDRMTIVVVDNLSPDGSAERLRARFPDVVHVQSGRNGGYTAGNNRGIEWAISNGADYVMVLNDDTVVEPNAVSRMVQAALESGADMVVPQIPYYDEPDTVWYAGGTYSRFRGMSRHLRENEPRDPSTERRPITFACGCCILARSEVFRAIGGFDESYFTYVEDLEFSIRAQASGYKMLYEPTAIVLHRIGRQAPPTPRQIVLRDTNRRRMVTRHYSAAEKVAFGIWFYPTRAIHFLRYLARGDWARVRAILTGALSRIDYSTSRTQLSFTEPTRMDQGHSARA